MLRALFTHSDQLLSQYQHFWQMQPFRILQLSQCSQLPEDLLVELQKLSPFDFQTLSQSRELGHAWLAPWLPCLKDLDALQRQIPMREADTSGADPVGKSILLKDLKPLSNGIPGRKWQQIEQFAEFLPCKGKGQRKLLLEWCAGKGHLGRLLSIRNGYQVSSLEWQQTLCDMGSELIEQQKTRYPQLQQRLLQGDAFSEEANKLLSHHHTAVALHACGDLHTRLITQCCQSEQSVRHLVIAPCCYHLTEAETYQPFSIAGQSSSLRLSRQDLKIPLQETVTGGQRIERLRDLELLWRLSFDQLRQQLTGETEYRPLPSFSKKLLSGEYHDFVSWALINRDLASSDEIQTAFPFSEIELSASLETGHSRLLTVRKLEWLQSFFRRALEIWLVADRALALEDAGFHVELYQFCEKYISPRNLLIQARRL